MNIGGTTVSCRVIAMLYDVFKNENILIDGKI